MSQPPSLEVGVAVLAVQLTEVIKDVTAVQSELAAHRLEHKEEKRDRETQRQLEKRNRVAGRRWLIGVTITLLGSVAGLYALLAQILVHR